MLIHMGCERPDATDPGISRAATTDPTSRPNEFTNPPHLSNQNADIPGSTLAEVSMIRFEPLSKEVFPSVIPENGSRHGFATILESLGSGGAAVDVDQDGRIDAIVAGGGDLVDRRFSGRPVYFLRNCRRLFLDCTQVAGLGKTMWYNHGVSVADFDHDGFQDLLITGYGGVHFFVNHGDGTFEESSQTAGLICPTWSSSAAWGDFNRDGHLDLYVAAYVNWSFENDPPCYAADGVRRDNCSPKLFEPLPDFLFINRGDGTFVDSTREFGIRGDSKALGVVVADLDFDGYVDIYVGNDVMMNFLYHNEQGQRLSDMSISSGAGISSRGSPDASMGVDVADYNLDGRPDLWAANFEMESFAIYQNQGNMLFRHMSDAAGISAIGEQYVGWGSAFADFDLDGDEDLCVCNGNVVQYPEHSPALQRMLVLENVEGSWFSDVTGQTGEALMVPKNGRGLALLDWNRDGRLDLLTTPTGSPAVLLQNTSQVTGHWLSLSLVGTQSPRQPIGATLELLTSAGRRIRQVKGGGSYASSSSTEIHFAVPEETTVNELIVRWPSGVVQHVKSPALNSHVCLIEPSLLSSQPAEIQPAAMAAGRYLLIQD